MQFMKRGNQTVILDGNTVYTLEGAVDLLAMNLFDDFTSLKKGVKNSNGKEVSMDEMREDMEVLKVLSAALSATRGLVGSP